MSMTASKELHVSAVHQTEQYAAVFAAFDELKEEEAVVLVCDHDPVFLHYMFELKRTGTYRWEYAAEGPMQWRVRLTYHAFDGQAKPRFDTLPRSPWGRAARRTCTSSPAAS